MYLLGQASLNKTFCIERSWEVNFRHRTITQHPTFFVTKYIKTMTCTNYKVPCRSDMDPFQTRHLHLRNEPACPNSLSCIIQFGWIENYRKQRRIMWYWWPSEARRAVNKWRHYCHINARKFFRLKNQKVRKRKIHHLRRCVFLVFYEKVHAGWLSN